LNPNAIKEEIRIQDLRVDVEGQLKKLAIDQLYNRKVQKVFILPLGAEF
jgi:hypothetical protein